MIVMIDSVACDTDVAGSIAVDYDVAALSDVESGREGVTLKLTLPATPRNESLFGVAGELHPAQGFNATWHKAEIVQDDATLFVGTAYLLATECDKGVRRLRIALRGGALQWAKQSAKKMFNQIAIDYSAVLTPSTIAQSWSDDSPVKFFPVHRDSYPLQNADVGLLPPETILSTMDYHPFISVEKLVKAIFDDCGYSIESRFLDSDFFRSLYMSGAFSSSDTEAQRRRMDFVAKRTVDSSAEANAYGRVYITPYMVANSVGNFVNTAAETVDAECYNNGGCFSLSDGVATFRPSVTTSVGFEYYIKYRTDFVIQSRTRLCGFDSIYFDSGIKFQYQIANRFVDRRESLLPNFSYRAVVFDYKEGDAYQIFAFIGDGKQLIASFSGRSAVVATPDVAAVKGAELYCKRSGESVYHLCDDDWALYDGYITETGETEVELTLRTPPQTVTPTSPKRFSTMYIEGAKEGMSFTLSHSSRLRPVFSASPGYGQVIRFADVAQHRIRQNQLLDALRQMFNLRIQTDERARRVKIEPAEMFYDTSRVVDWSDKITTDAPIVFADAAQKMHSRQTLAYAQGDASVARFDAEGDTVLGEWSFDVDSYAAIEGEQRLVNSLFAPTVSDLGYYSNAESAQIMQVGDRDALTSDDMNFSPRIVRYVGLAPLPDDECWGFPSHTAEYPLAAFHFAGDELNDPFSLCFENRDGVEGLHTLYDKQWRRMASRQTITLSLRLSPSDIEALTIVGGASATVGSCFLFTIEGEQIICTLERIEAYDPTQKSTRCTFLILR